MSHSLCICLSSYQGHGPCPISRLWQPCVLYMEKVVMIVLMCGWGIETGGRAEAQELRCLPLRGQQEAGLSCPDDRWPPWRQSRFKLLPGLFENILGPAWVIGHMGHCAIQESPHPTVQTWSCGRREEEAWQSPPRTVTQMSGLQFTTARCSNF